MDGVFKQTYTAISSVPVRCWLWMVCTNKPMLQQLQYQSGVGWGWYVPSYQCCNGGCGPPWVPVKKGVYKIYHICFLVVILPVRHTVMKNNKRAGTAWLKMFGLIFCGYRPVFTYCSPILHCRLMYDIKTDTFWHPRWIRLRRLLLGGLAPIELTRLLSD